MSRDDYRFTAVTDEEASEMMFYLHCPDGGYCHPDTFDLIYGEQTRGVEMNESYEMAGLVEQAASNTVFLEIKYDGICEVSKEPKEGFDEITVRNPRTNQDVVKYIKRYNAVEALITKIEWWDTKDAYEHRFMSWKVHLNANGVPCVLDFPFKSRVGHRFMQTVENFDIRKPVSFRAWFNKEDKSMAIMFRQDGKNVPARYSKDNMGDCPPPTQNALGEWDFGKMNEFLYQRMQNIVIPAVEACGNPMPTGIGDLPQPDSAAIYVDGDDEEYHSPVDSHDVRETNAQLEAEKLPPLTEPEHPIDDDEIPF